MRADGEQAAGEEPGAPGLGDVEDDGDAGLEEGGGDVVCVVGVRVGRREVDVVGAAGVGGGVAVVVRRVAVLGGGRGGASGAGRGHLGLSSGAGGHMGGGFSGVWHVAIWGTGGLFCMDKDTDGGEERRRKKKRLSWLGGGGGG